MLILYRYRNDHERNFTETVKEMILKTDTEMIGCFCLKFFQRVLHLFTYLLAPVAVSSFRYF